MKKIIIASLLGFGLFWAVGTVFANYYDNKQNENNNGLEAKACKVENEQKEPVFKSPSSTSEPSHCVDETKEKIID
jgi:hypothetical protein